MMAIYEHELPPQSLNKNQLLTRSRHRPTHPNWLPQQLDAAPGGERRVG